RRGHRACESRIAALRRPSPEFAGGGERHEVSRSGEGRKALRPSLVGMMSFPHAVFRPAEKLDQRLVLYSPLPENETAAKLSRLMSMRAKLATAAVPPRPVPEVAVTG